MTHLALPAAYLRAVNLFASTDPCRFILAGVLVEITPASEKEGFRTLLVATDRRRIFVLNASERTSFPSGHAEAASFIIPSALIVSAPKPQKNGDIEINVNDTSIELAGLLNSTKATAVKGDYPKWREVLPSGDDIPMSRLSINVGFLQDFVRAEKLLNTSGLGVRISQKVREDGPYIIKPCSLSAPWIGVLMPTRIESDGSVPAWIQ